MNIIRIMLLVIAALMTPMLLATVLTVQDAGSTVNGVDVVTDADVGSIYLDNGSIVVSYSSGDDKVLSSDPKVGGGVGTHSDWDTKFAALKQLTSITDNNPSNSEKIWGTSADPKIASINKSNLTLKKLSDSHGVLLIEGDDVTLSGVDYHGLVIIKATSVTLTGDTELHGGLIVLGATTVKIKGSSSVHYDSEALKFAESQLASTSTSNGTLHGLTTIVWSEVNEVIGEKAVSCGYNNAENISSMGCN